MATPNNEIRDTAPAISEDNSIGQICCPTCGAQQEKAGVSAAADSADLHIATCRRCGSDLQLVIALREKVQQLQHRCLSLMRQRRLLHATRLAKQCCELSSTDANSRLLATCYLLSGDFAAAGRCLGAPQ